MNHLVDHDPGRRCSSCVIRSIGHFALPFEREQKPPAALSAPEAPLHWFFKLKFSLFNGALQLFNGALFVAKGTDDFTELTLPLHQY